MTSTTPQHVNEELYSRVQQFYADRLRRLDDGDASGWAASFTEDGTFETNARPEPSRGRKAIESETRAAATRLTENKIRRRHWVGMMSVTQTDPAEVAVEAYSLVIEIELGKEPRLAYSLTLRSRVHLDGYALLVSHEIVKRDDM